MTNLDDEIIHCAKINNDYIITDKTVYKKIILCATFIPKQKTIVDGLVHIIYLGILLFDENSKEENTLFIEDSCEDNECYSNK